MIMTVKKLIEKYYNEIIIYTNLDEEFTEFKDLYKGTKENIPQELLNKKVKCFGAKAENLIEISV